MVVDRKCYPKNNVQVLHVIKDSRNGKNHVYLIGAVELSEIQYGKVKKSIKFDRIYQKERILRVHYH
ncbi:MAG: hypothetical protein ACE5SW_12300 [Nitrososphaeraceae archaeon]